MPAIPLSKVIEAGRLPFHFLPACFLLILTSCGQAQSPQTPPLGASTLTDSSPSAGSQQKPNPNGVSVATLAGGCFWCTEAVFERMEGVHDVISGYIGGHVPNPTYQQVLTKLTGHAEAVEIYYDPRKTNFEELLEVFFKIHDPTTLNRQGNDIGPQYRSSIFIHNDEQREIAQQMIEKLNEAGEFRTPIVTKLEEATKFYPAEEYHQDYYRKNPNAGYCQVVVRSKVRKFNRTFSDKIKKDLK